MPNQTRRVFAAAGGLAVIAALAGRRDAIAAPDVAPAGTGTGTAAYPVQHTPAEWRKLLSPAAYDVLREEGTEMPWSSPLLHVSGPGRFSCAGCTQPLFETATKFDSGTGWPSFWAPLPHAVLTRSDDSLMMSRTEVHCIRCGGHLGHVFDDGPKPTGLRYCMNGVAMTFAKA